MWCGQTHAQNYLSDNGTFQSVTTGTSANQLFYNSAGNLAGATVGSGLSLSGGTLTANGLGGTVTSVSVVNANGVSGTVANATTTPAITLSLGAITPTTINGNTITTGTGTLTLAAGKTLTDTSGVGANLLLGTTGGGFAAYGGAAACNSGNFISALSAAGAETCAGLSTLTFGTHLASGGSSYNGTTGVTITSDATAANTASTIMARDGSGQVAATTFTGALAGNASTATSATSASSAPVSGLTGAGTGVLTALGTNVGTAGSFVVNGGALGSPSSAGTLPAHTLGGTVSGGGNQINNVVIGSSTPLAGAFTTITGSQLTVTTAANVAAALAFTDSTNYTFNIGAGTSLTPSASALFGPIGGSSLALLTNSTERVRFITGTCFGCTSDPGSGSIQVNAQIFAPNMTSQSTGASGSVCWTTSTGKFTVDTTLACLTSSARFKNIVGTLSPEKALGIVEKLETVSFTKKEEFGGVLDPAEQFGFTAEQAASVDERLIARDPEGKPLGVRYAEFTAVLAGAVKQLKADNDNLRACQQNWKCRIFGMTP